MKKLFKKGSTFDQLGRNLDHAVKNATGIQPSHIVNTDASDHKQQMYLIKGMGDTPEVQAQKLAQAEAARVQAAAEEAARVQAAAEVAARVQAAAQEAARVQAAAEEAARVQAAAEEAARVQAAAEEAAKAQAAAQEVAKAQAIEEATETHSVDEVKSDTVTEEALEAKANEGATAKGEITEEEKTSVKAELDNSNSLIPSHGKEIKESDVIDITKMKNLHVVLRFKIEGNVKVETAEGEAIEAPTGKVIDTATYIDLTNDTAETPVLGNTDSTDIA